MKKITLFIPLLLSMTSPIITSAEKDPKKKKDTIIHNIYRYAIYEKKPKKSLCPDSTDKPSKPSATHDPNNPNLTEKGYTVCPRQRISGRYILL